MEYFRLQQDQRVPGGAMMVKLNEILNYQQGAEGKVLELDRMVVSFVQSSKLNHYHDVLDQQLYMVKGPVKEVFDLFVPDMQYKACCLLDGPNDLQTYYEIPALEMVDCCSANSTANENRSVISHVVLKGDKIAYKDVFRVAGVKDKVVVVSLPVAERILQRKPDGIRLTPVGVE